MGFWKAGHRSGEATRSGLAPDTRTFLPWRRTDPESAETIGPERLEGRRARAARRPPVMDDGGRRRDRSAPNRPGVVACAKRRPREGRDPGDRTPTLGVGLSTLKRMASGVVRTTYGVTEHPPSAGEGSPFQLAARYRGRRSPDRRTWRRFSCAASSVGNQPSSRTITYSLPNRARDLLL